jgi:hypothetical protein
VSISGTIETFRGAARAEYEHLQASSNGVTASWRHPDWRMTPLSRIAPDLPHNGNRDGRRGSLCGRSILTWSSDAPTTGHAAILVAVASDAALIDISADGAALS